MGVGHLVPLESPQECAGVVGAWIEGEVRRWQELERQRIWGELEKEEKDTVIGNWMAGLKSKI
jgi:hypothetical protein